MKAPLLPKNTAVSSPPPSAVNTANQPRAILFLIISVVALASMDTAAKRLGLQVHVSQILWARYAGQLIIMTLLFGPRLRQYVRTDHPKLQIIRGLFQLIAAGCFFTALKSIGLAEATAVADLAPVLITLAAALILGETVGLRRSLGVGAALIGALIIIRPGSDIFSFSALWPLGTAVSVAGFAIITRYIGPKESPFIGMLYTGVVGTLIMTLFLPFYWTPLPLSSIALLVCVGILGTLGQFMMTKAFMIAQASAIAPFTYAGLLTATLWGWLFFGDIPDFWSCVGALVIVGAGLYVWSRERYVAKQP